MKLHTPLIFWQKVTEREVMLRRQYVEDMKRDKTMMTDATA